MAYEVERFIPAQNILGEGPVWSAEEQCLYWVDIQGKAFFKYDYASGTHTRYQLNQQIGCLTPNHDGRVIMGLEEGIGIWDYETQTIKILEDNEAFNPAGRFNDGAVDREGRFILGTMAPDAGGKLFRLDHDGSVTVLQTGIKTSNGIGWSPDNKTMYYSDSGVATVYAFDYDITTGSLSNRRIFLQTDRSKVGAADGLTVDAEGGVWCAFWDGWRIARYLPDGTEDFRIEMPVQRATSCNFGGPDMDELFITSASTGFTDEEKAKQPYAGDVFRVKTQVKGLPETIARINF